ncbi:MAG: ftsX [Bacillales bacterium]|nr:ftsX [Bacillales bacterium]
MKCEVTTAMKLRTIARHLKEGLKNVGRNGWMTFASVSAVTVTLLLLGVFLVVMLNINNFGKNLEEDVEIKVYVDLTATDEQLRELGETIRDIPGVSQLRYSSKDEELKNLINSLGDQGKAWSMFEQENPLHNAYFVKTSDPRETSKVAERLKTLDFVSEVKYGEAEIKRLFKVVDISRNVGMGLVLGLSFTAMFLISNTIKITIFARRREIEIMKLVGATNWFIRWPFIIEGLLLGVFGAVTPIALIYWGYSYAYDIVSPMIDSSFIRLLPTEPFIYKIAGILILIGALIGMWGSTMSIRKFLKV